MHRRAQELGLALNQRVQLPCRSVPNSGETPHQANRRSGSTLGFSRPWLALGLLRLLLALAVNQDVAGSSRSEMAGGGWGGSSVGCGARGGGGEPGLLTRVSITPAPK